jgi:hypothetical protein
MGSAAAARRPIIADKKTRTHTDPAKTFGHVGTLVKSEVLAFHVLNTQRQVEIADAIRKIAHERTHRLCLGGAEKAKVHPFEEPQSEELASQLRTSTDLST